MLFLKPGKDTTLLILLILISWRSWKLLRRKKRPERGLGFMILRNLKWMSHMRKLKNSQERFATRKLCSRLTSVLITPENLLSQGLVLLKRGREVLEGSRENLRNLVSLILKLRILIPISTELRVSAEPDLPKSRNCLLILTGPIQQYQDHNLD